MVATINIRKLGASVAQLIKHLILDAYILHIIIYIMLYILYIILKENNITFIQIL